MAAESSGRRERGPDRALDGIGTLQGLAKAVAGPFLRPYFRMRVEGAGNVPPSGPVVLVANHASMWDIPLLVVACPRPIVFMARQELYDTRLKNWFFSSLGGFPVQPGQRDVQAMRLALAVVRSGRMLGIYPEGTRNRGPELLPFFPGAGMIALAEGVPMVPAALSGTGRILPDGARVPRRATVRIAFGEPVRVEREADPVARRARALEVVADLRARVERLLAESVV